MPDHPEAMPRIAPGQLLDRAIRHARPAAEQADAQRPRLGGEKGGEEVRAVQIRRKQRTVQQPAAEVDADPIRQDEEGRQAAPQAGIAARHVDEIGIAEGELDMPAFHDRFA